MQFLSEEALVEAVYPMLSDPNLSREEFSAFLDAVEIVAPANHSTAAAATASSSSSSSTKCTAVHVAKKPADHPCAFCTIDIQEDGQEELSWCKAGCGRSVHTACMDEWWANTVKGWRFKCPDCRAEWAPDCGC